MAGRKLSKEDWDTLLTAIEAGLSAIGVPAPLRLAQRLVEMVRRRWTQDGRLVPEYETEAGLQLIEEAIDPLAGAALDHARDLDELKRGQDQIVELLFRVLREREAGDPEGNKLVLFEGPRQTPVRSVAHFEGRDDELAELERLLLGDHRFVCLVATGIGGIGKTTLVEEFVAARAPELFPEGVAWLDGRELVAELGRVSRRFGWTDEHGPDPSEAIGLLCRVLHAKRVLLVVDDFDPDVGELDHVPRPGGHCRTLVTSRARALDVDLDAARLELGVWTLDACRAYLLRRCPQIQTTADEIEALAQFVGRLPLGVRLLVSLVRQRKSLSLSGLLRLLGEQPLGALDRYTEARGVAATFQASYDSLDPIGRRVLQALAVCAQQTRADVVAAVADVEAMKAGELLDHLHVRGLAEYGSEAPAAWDLHDVIRMFVLTQPGADEFERAHTAWVLAHLEAHSDATAHRAFAVGVAEARRVFERLLAADVAGAHAIYRSLERHLTLAGRYPEAMSLSQALLERVPEPSEMAGGLLNDLALGHRKRGDTAAAVQLFERALIIAEQLGSLQGQSSVLGNLGLCYQTLGDMPRAVESFERALAKAEELGDLQVQANQLGNLGCCYEILNELPRAIWLHAAALAINERLANLHGQANQLVNLGIIYMKLGEIAQGIATFERSLALAKQLGGVLLQATALWNLGTCHLTLGDVPRAIDAFVTSLATYEELGHLEEQARAHVGLGLARMVLATATGQTLELARNHLARARELYGCVGVPDDHPYVKEVERLLRELA